MVPLMVVKLHTISRRLRGGGFYNSRPAHLPCDSEQKDQGSKANDVRDQRCDQQELCKLGRSPRSLQISAPVKDGNARNAECEKIVLDQRRRQKGPRIYERQLGHQGEVGDYNIALCGPLTVPDCAAQERLQDQRDEENPRYRGDVESGRHGVVCVSLQCPYSVQTGRWFSVSNSFLGDLARKEEARDGPCTRHT